MLKWLQKLLGLLDNLRSKTMSNRVRLSEVKADLERTLQEGKKEFVEISRADRAAEEKRQRLEDIRTEVRVIQRRYL